MKMERYNKRWIQILYFFLANNKKVSGDSISLSVGVSSRTIRNDMKELNIILREYDAKIVSEIGHGYILEIKNNDRFQRFLDEVEMAEKLKPFHNIIPSSSEERVWYITSKLLLNSLNDKEYMETFNLAEELFISVSTLKKDLKTVSEILKKYNLKISETKKSGMRVVGEESRIRFCISEYIFNNLEMTGGNDQRFYEKIFGNYDLNLIQDILTDTIIEYDLRLSDIAFKNLIVHSLIMLKRIKDKKQMKYNQREIQLFTVTNEFNCAKEIVKKINKKLDISLGDEVYYLTQLLISSQRFLIENPNDDYTYKEAVIKILSKIKNETSIALLDDIQLINGLAIHLRVAFQRMRFDMNIRNEFLDTIKNSYPLAFELAVLAGNVIKEEYGLKTKETELGFLSIHLGAALERKGINKNKGKKKIALVCIAGVAMALLLKEKLEQRFAQYIEIVKSCPASEVTPELINQVDMVLTTVDLPKFCSEKVKKIKPFLNDDDLNELSALITELEEQYQTINYSNIFRRELFFKEKNFKNKQEILEYMTNAMLKKNYITETVKASVFKREEMATTELGGLLAIPHALFNDMTDIAVSVMILKKPIIWENEKVQVVLLLNIPQNKYDIWEIIFKNLYQYLIVKSGIKRLVKYQCYDQFISDLLE